MPGNRMTTFRFLVAAVARSTKAGRDARQPPPTRPLNKLAWSNAQRRPGVMPGNRTRGWRLSQQVPERSTKAGRDARQPLDDGVDHVFD